MQVAININEPLASTLLCSENKRALEIRYERLIEFCHKCGRVGHKEKFCGIKGDYKEDEVDRDKFGRRLKFENYLTQNPKIKRLNSEKMKLLQIDKEEAAKLAGVHETTAKNLAFVIGATPKEKPTYLTHNPENRTTVNSFLAVANP